MSRRTPDPWYDGKGMDATEASVVFGFGTAASGRIERGLGSFGAIDADRYLADGDGA